MAIGDKPTDVPEWASGPDADILAPDAGKKALGYVYREKPGRKVLNWLLNLTYQWFAFITTRFNAAGWLNLGSSTNSLQRINRTGAVDFIVAGSLVSILTATITRATSSFRLGQAAEETEGVELTAPLAGSGENAESLALQAINGTKRAGMVAASFKPQSVSGASTYFTETAFPLAESLYRENTPKLVVQIIVTDSNEDGRYDTIAIAGGYNVSTINLNLTTIRTITVTPIDIGAQFLFGQIVPGAGGNLPKPVIVSGVGTGAITATAWNGTDWVDLFAAGVAATFGGPVRINIVGF